MAGDWLKFEKSTSDKPEVWAMAEELGIDPDAVVGKLLRVWGWFDEQSEDGSAPKSVIPMIDRKVGMPGFCEAMQVSGWMVIDGEKAVLPNYESHNSSTAKKRAMTAKRVAKHKSNAKGNASVTQGETKSERTPIPRPIRRQVLERDSHTCVYCSRVDGEYSVGETAGDSVISIDHVIPVIKGGENSLENLVACCIPCNKFKGDRTPEEAQLPWPKDREGKRYGSVTNALPREEKRREEDKPPKSPKGDDVPYGEIFSLYHEILPELPPAPNQTQKRKDNIKARWFEKVKVPAKGGFEEWDCNTLEFWQRFFGRVANSPHLMGENDRGWQANLEWVTKKENFYKIIEGNYVRSK